MAAVSLLPSPQQTQVTMSRRVPLGNLPNAANSPYRGTAPGTKRPRSHADSQRELAYAQPPPAKKQMLEGDVQGSLRQAQFRKAGYNNPPNGLQKKLEAVVRDGGRQITKAPEKASKTGFDNLESIRQWQRHYKKVFPQVVFYYESIPDDVRAKLSRQVQSLGSVSQSRVSRGGMIESLTVYTARGSFLFQNSHARRYYS
jgi:regulatory subunit for Cdc7p protein kinase